MMAPPHLLVAVTAPQEEMVIMERGASAGHCHREGKDGHLTGHRGEGAQDVRLLVVARHAGQPGRA